MQKEEILKLPKIDLHCHLDGSLTLGCVRELLQREVSLEELQVADDCRSLAEYLERFDLPLQCLQTEAGLQRAGYDFITNVAKENIRYIEVRFAPLLSVNEQLDVKKVMQAVLDGLEKGKQETGVEYQVIACAMRHQAQEDSLQMMKALREFLGNGLCAVDLAGNEAAFPMKDYMGLFAEAQKLGYPLTLHAGECGNVDNILDSVACGAKRIGHGIALTGHPEAIAICREKGIGLEMCPISNLQTKAVEGPEHYPLREFLNAGLCVTLNTDNRTVSNTSISREMEFVQKQFGITDEEIIDMLKNAAKVAFAPETATRQLEKGL